MEWKLSLILEDILQRRSDTVESTELEQEGTTEVPETTESTETKGEEGDADIKEEENEIVDEDNNEIEKTDPKTDASTQESSSATSFVGLSNYLLLIFLVLPHM